MGLVVVEFKSVHCHPGFDVINTLPHEEEGIWDLDRGFPELRVIGVCVAKDRVLLNVRGKRRCVKTTESKLVEHRMRWELAGSEVWQWMLTDWVRVLAYDENRSKAVPCSLKS